MNEQRRVTENEVKQKLGELLIEIRRLAESDSLPQRVINAFDAWDRAQIWEHMQREN